MEVLSNMDGLQDEVAKVSGNLLTYVLFQGGLKPKAGWICRAWIGETLSHCACTPRHCSTSSRGCIHYQIPT